jgi:hypothetical protein
MPLDQEAQLFAQESAIVCDKNMFCHDVRLTSVKDFSNNSRVRVSGKKGTILI